MPHMPNRPDNLPPLWMRHPLLTLPDGLPSHQHQQMRDTKFNNEARITASVFKNMNIHKIIMMELSPVKRPAFQLTISLFGIK